MRSRCNEYASNGTTLKYEYIRGLGLGGGIGSILYQREDASPDKFYYYHYNHKGDVYALTDHPADTNDVEEIMALYEYDVWGRTTVQALKDGVTNEFRFSTKQHDPGTGLIYFGARYYDPTLGRWTQMDPAGTVDGLNLYIYVRNKAVILVDSTGLACDITFQCVCTDKIRVNDKFLNDMGFCWLCQYKCLESDRQDREIPDKDGSCEGLIPKSPLLTTFSWFESFECPDDAFTKRRYYFAERAGKWIKVIGEMDIWYKNGKQDPTIWK